MGKVYNNGNKIIVEDNGRTVWSTDYPPVNLFPASDWLTPTVSVNFPDFGKFANYAYQRVSNTDGVRPPWALSGSGDVCQTVTMIVPEDSNFGDTYLGSVPSGANYVDVRARVTRTKAPNNYLDQPVPQLVSNGRWVSLPGGSCLIEATNIWRRLFEVRLSGTSVYLNRRQSVAPAPTWQQGGNIYYTEGSTADPYLTFGFSVWGWSNGGGFVGTQRPGHPAALIEVKEFSPNNGASVPTMGAKHPARERRCSTDTSIHDFSSSYTVEFQIRPGYIKP